MPASVTLERFTCDFGTAAMLTGAATRKRTVGSRDEANEKPLKSVRGVTSSVRLLRG